MGYFSFCSLFISYFLHLHFKCYPGSPLYPPSVLPPYPPTPTSWPWHSPVVGHIKFARPRGLSSQWWPSRPWKTFFSPAFHSDVVSVFAIEVCFLYATKCWILLAYQSVSLWLFIGELSQLMLKDNKYIWLLVPVMFVVVGRIKCMWFSPFDFIVRWLISYFFFLWCRYPPHVGTHLVLEFPF